MQYKHSLSDTSLHNWLTVLAVAGVVFLTATMVPAQASTAQAIPEVDVQAVTDGISVKFSTHTGRNLLAFSVRVVGPDRFVFEQRVEESTLPWIPPADLADGYYHWEAWVVSADVGAPMRERTPALEARAADHWFDEEFKQTHITTGSFRVEGGLLQTHSPPRDEGEGASRIQRVAASMLDFLVPTARAATEGTSNNFFGTGAGESNTSGTANSFFGGDAGESNTSGNNNSFFGRFAGEFNITGSGNSFFGYTAGLQNTSGFDNSFFGRGAGNSNSTGDRNAFFGSAAGGGNTEGSDNAFFGYEAGSSNTTGDSNSFFGRLAGFNNTTGFNNAFFGREAGFFNTTGSDNAFFGRNAGLGNTTGFRNSFFGRSAGFNNSTGSSNAFFGRAAGRFNTTGFGNSFFGHDAGESNTEGINNAFFGGEAGLSNTTENNNTFIGTFSDGAAGITNATAVGFRAKVTQSNSLVLGSVPGRTGSFNTDVGIGITAPAAPLHVRRFNNTAQVRVEDTGAADGQTLFSLINNGHPKFRFQDSSQSDVRWEFATIGTQGLNEGFNISKIASGSNNAIFRANGDLEIAGSLSQGSSRAIKDDINPVDTRTVLAKLDALEISEWS